MTRQRTMLIAGAAAGLIVLVLLSLAVGSRAIPLTHVVTALVDPANADPETAAIVRGTRLTRTIVAILAGAALGLAGAVMQGLTRNPLADPGLLGVSAGAAFGIVAASTALPLLTGAALGPGTTAPGLLTTVWFAFGGAALAAVVVYFLGSRGGAAPVKLALAGVAVTYLLDSLTSGLALTNPEALDRYRYWSAGSLSGHSPEIILTVLPFLVAGAVLALGTAPALNSLALGDDVARTLGRRLGATRVRAAVAVTVLTGAAVAVTGPIVFVGLAVPHLVRMVTGPDHRWLLPGAALLAPCLLLVADILGRVVARPQEIDVSLVAALLGAPFFIALVRRRRVAEL
ncbi:FecCD family ABC transporter permease [Nonomuraea typhae]|uniref:FecCD family ABC transporter permease n=1 Tax=Nonomuraea typhae TaxID=2603600 RepID=UPI001FE2B863|nr:iron ABC transporter permease [Nonomuraea typhae]